MKARLTETVAFLFLPPWDLYDDTMSDAAAYERMVKLRQVEVDVELKQKQVVWETPRNLAVLVATVAALSTALGYKLGSQPQVIQVQLPSPLPTLAVPATPGAPAR